MDFLRRELVGGLILIAALATFAGGDFRLTPLVLALFALGGLWTVVVAIHALRGRIRPTDGTARRLADLLQKSYEDRDRVRHTSDRQAMFDASQSFIKLGNDAEKLLRDEAPEYASDFQEASRAPWALQGKAEVLKLMDARLKVHSEIVKKLRGRD